MASDHITPATGLVPTVTISKNGAAFATPLGAVSEIGSGWYKVAANASDANTVGVLLLHATAATADPADEEFDVVDSTQNFTVPTVVASLSGFSSTVLELIKMALLRIGAIAAGETPNSDDAEDARQRLNGLIDQWAAERLTIYTVTRTTWTIVANTQSYTLGVGGTINIARPVFLHAVRYQDTSVSPTAEYDLGSGMTEDEYAAVPQKTRTATYPTGWYYNPTYPTGTLRLLPTPTGSTLQGVLYAPAAVGLFSALTDIVSLPPGYHRFLRDNLAIELAPEWEQPVSPQLARSAEEAKAVVKASNRRRSPMGMDAALVPLGHGMNIYTG